MWMWETRTHAHARVDLSDLSSAMIIAWLHNGLDKAEYDAHIKPIIEQRCLSCHGGSNPHIRIAPISAGGLAPCCLSAG